MSRRNRVFILFVALVAPVALVVAGTEGQPMDGTWKPLTAEFAGKKWPQTIIDHMKLVLKDGKYLVEDGGETDEGTATCDVTKSPKTMEIKGTNGPNKGKTFLAIYELKADEMRVCYDLSGKSYPKEFATKANSLLFLVTYRKSKP